MDNWKQQVAKWVAIDNQIIELKTKISELNDIHNSITDEVLDFVEEHNMSGKTIRIADGDIFFKEKKRLKSNSIKIIEEALKLNGINPVAVINSISELKQRSAETDLTIVRTFK